ncbi:MAG TPA: CCA tRNA nucleotidyltransferase [Tepidisphaeraceae bacterium]|jgi:poly(A) polymerase|nr:CCA tRNA nucleotidyltransferase [Tepidisphaeraceae bacterium]
MEDEFRPNPDFDQSGPAKPRCEREDALFVLRRLRDADYAAYFAGGCVRDLLLGREPKDWDVATDAPPERVRTLFSNTQAVGAAFGVILVRKGGSAVEVATFRADAQYVDGRHPTAVRFTTAQEDAQRRDFTINGLFLDPLKDAPLEGQVIDYVGGRDDLKARLIRAIGDPDARFNEDHLRMLRAVRFAARFGFEIEPATAAAIRSHSPQLTRISPERIADELRTMLTPPARVEAYRLLDSLHLRGLLFRFFPPSNGGARMDRSVSVFNAAAPGRGVAFALSLAAASLDEQLWRLPPASDPRPLFQRSSVQKVVHALRQSLKISNEESEAVQGALEGIAPLVTDAYPTVATLKRFLALPTSDLSRELLESLRVTATLDGARVEQLQKQLAALEQTEFAPPPLITGDDLTAAGMSPGPAFKRILDAAYDAQLEDRITTREQAMEMAMRLAAEKK